MPFPSSPKKLKLYVNKLQVVKLSENATLLTKGSPLAAGYDLYSAEVRGSHVVTSFFYSLLFRSPLFQPEAKGLSRLTSRSVFLAAPTVAWLRGLASPGKTTWTLVPGW